MAEVLYMEHPLTCMPEKLNPHIRVVEVLVYGTLSNLHARNIATHGIYHLRQGY